MAGGQKPRTLEARRAGGEQVAVLPVVVGGRPTIDEIQRPPAGLDKWAKAAWREVVPQLVASKLIDRIDRQALEAYCLHIGRARALGEAIEWVHEGPSIGEDGTVANAKTLGRRIRRKTLEEQFIAETVRGFTSNPLLGQEREAWREARMSGELLGLNPVGRTRLVGRKPERSGLATLTGDLPRPQLIASNDE